LKIYNLIRDLKPENLLYDKAGPDGQIKIADFGVSRHLKTGKKFHRTVGTVDSSISL